MGGCECVCVCVCACLRVTCIPDLGLIGIKGQVLGPRVVSVCVFVY